MLSKVDDALGQGVTIICRFLHVLGAAISLLVKDWSGTGSYDNFKLRNHVLEEFSPRLTINECLRVPTIKGFGVYAARLVEFDDDV